MEQDEDFTSELKLTKETLSFTLHTASGSPEQNNSIEIEDVAKDSDASTVIKKAINLKNKYSKKDITPIYQGKKIQGITIGEFYESWIFEGGFMFRIEEEIRNEIKRGEEAFDSYNLGKSKNPDIDQKESLYREESLCGNPIIILINNLKKLIENFIENISKNQSLKTEKNSSFDTQKENRKADYLILEPGRLSQTPISFYHKLKPGETGSSEYGYQPNNYVPLTPGSNGS